jgi:hypothetical protein
MCLSIDVMVSWLQYSEVNWKLSERKIQRYEKKIYSKSSLYVSQRERLFMIMIKLRKVWRFYNGYQKLKSIDAQYNGKKEKNYFFELSEHMKLIITMNFSREKKSRKNNTLQILKFNRNIVETVKIDTSNTHWWPFTRLPWYRHLIKVAG